MSKYSDKLKDPRWQKKRLEILQRDNWACQRCEDKDDTLVVHHKDYLTNTEPWDYPNDLLITLCEQCHELEIINDRNEIEQLLIHRLRKYFWSDDLFNIYDGLKKLPQLNSEESWILSEVINWVLSSSPIRKELIDRVWILMQGVEDAK